MNFFQKNILTPQELERIAESIRTVEKGTVGEIRVSIQKRRSFKERSLTLNELAVKNFYALGMDQTKGKTGVLIYLLLSDRAFHIIGDEGINAKVKPEFWNQLAQSMADHFRQNKFADGICRTVTEVGAVLTREFPMKSGDTNELSNDVVIS